MNNFNLTKYLAEGKLKETFVKLSDEQKAKVISAAKRGEAPEDVIDSDFDSDDKYLQSVKALMDKTLMDKSKLNEAELRPLSDEQLESVAQSIAFAFTSDDVDGLDLQYIVTPNSVENSTPRGGGFDLDVEAGRNTPDGNWRDENGFDISNYLGAYAGGSYVIRPNPDKSDEYLVTNAAMRNAKVARVYFEGDTLKFEMFPADESIPRSSDEVEAQRKKEKEMANVFVRENKNEDALLNIIMKYVKDPSEAEEELEKYQDRGFQGFSSPLAANLERDDEWKNLTEEKKSNKMKKSELKEMIKAAMLNEASEFDTNKPARIEAFLKSLDDLVDEYHAELYLNDDLSSAIEDVKSAAKVEMGGPVDDIPGFEGTMDALDSLSIREEKKEDKEEEVEDEEIDVDIDQEEVNMDMDMDMEDGGEVGLTGDKKVVDDSLEAALEAARALGDEKLVDQIGNTITFFTRSQIVKEEKVEEGASTEEKRIAMSAVKRIAKYRGVSEDEARNDLIRAAEELGSPPQIHSAKDEQRYLEEAVNALGMEEKMLQEVKRMQRIAGIIK